MDSAPEMAKGEATVMAVARVTDSPTVMAMDWAMVTAMGSQTARLRPLQ
jgi:hypothetical protein